MKKIGIITHYYQSTNYGGNLQAYALCEVLIKNKYQVEQICYPFYPLPFEKNRIKNLFANGVIGFFKKLWNYTKRVFILPLEKIEIRKLDFYNCRRKAFLEFNKNIIPHSEIVYTRDTIKDSVLTYDVFITGSDQVWNLAWYDSAYFLDFVPSKKLKMSYAASIAKDSLTAEQKEMFRESLKDYKAVSVREESAVNLLKDISPVETQLVLDPTLLLTKEDWDKVCAERVIEEEYVFCYFLGENRKERKIAEKCAEKQGLTLVAIPHTAGIKLIDRKFGDKRLYDVSPQQFVSLIKHAKYIFTDSFHAVVFSNIYQKNYFVFNRNKKGEMNSRIINITKLFHQEERFCNGKERECLEYVESLPDIDYTQENKEFEALKEKSLAFLKENLG